MGRFEKFVSEETKAKSSTIVVNKYEIPENVLEIMAQICSPKEEKNVGAYFNEVVDILFPDQGDSFKEFCEQDNGKFWSEFKEFRNDFKELFNDLMIALQSHEKNNTTQVVVAGAFSSEKSTFLNTILELNGLLPTGVEPVSIVNTFIYCTKNTDQVNVKGFNLKNVLVQLDTDVLQCIQHASKSKVYLASVLEKMLIEYPANDLTEGLSFIDTPGYNNSDKKNYTNGKTDEETMRQALGKGDVLFWIVDSEDGTVKEKDRQMINHFLEEHKDGKVLIVFNKSDKKGDSDIKKILKATARQFKVGQDSHYIDVIGYSSTDNAFHSFKGYNSLKDVFQQVRNCGTGYSEVQRIMNDVKSLFDNRIEWHKNEKKDWDEALKESKKAKNEWYKALNKFKGVHKKDIEVISDIILDSYSEIEEAADDTYHVVREFHDDVTSFYSDMIDTGSAQWGSGYEYDKAVDRAESCIDSFMEELNDAYEYESFSEESRQEAVEVIKKRYAFIDDHYKSTYDDICSDIDRYQSNV